MLIPVYLSLGSNIGDREKQIQSAVKELENGKEIEIVEKSSFFETEPVGPKDQSYFINIALKIMTSYGPFELLDICKDTEKYIGRVDRKKWREREIDIDIIFYNDLVLENEILTIPHKEFQNRRFVLEPLNEIAPNFVCPLSGKTVNSILNICKDTSLIKRLN